MLSHASAQLALSRQPWHWQIILYESKTHIRWPSISEQRRSTSVAEHFSEHWHCGRELLRHSQFESLLAASPTTMVTWFVPLEVTVAAMA